MFSSNFDEPITEIIKPEAKTFKGLALTQAEELCENYRKNLSLDIVTLRLDHLYSIPKDKDSIDNVCARMCLKALENEYVVAKCGREISMLYEADAVEFIYKLVKSKHLNYPLYHLASGNLITELEMADTIAECMDYSVDVWLEDGEKYKKCLSNTRLNEEFSAVVFDEYRETIKKMVKYMTEHKDVFLNEIKEEKSLLTRIKERLSQTIKILLPYIENIICFIPFFMLNNRATGSDYFSNLDFYLIYVLLFAIVYGQQQATISAILSVIGYCFRQMYDRSGFSVMLDYNTYVWIAQLFIFGLVVGYMRDEIGIIRSENEEERNHLNQKLADILEINNSNVRVKDVLERQVIGQKDSIGKVYSMTSALDKYMPDEVLFYAVELIGQMMDSKDVAIYGVYNEDYARIFSASSKKARGLGNSIKYREMTEVFETINDKKVYINRQLDEKYPLMANAIFENDKMQLIIMVWGIPWERMTLGQANLLKVISYLIQNAVLRSNRYMAALKSQRYIGDTKIMEMEAFSSLVNAYENAKLKGLTECTLLCLDARIEEYREIGDRVSEMLRQTDYLGVLGDKKLYILLANTNSKDAEPVINRFEAQGLNVARSDGTTI